MAANRRGNTDVLARGDVLEEPNRGGGMMVIDPSREVNPQEPETPDPEERNDDLAELEAAEIEGSVERALNELEENRQYARIRIYRQGPGGYRDQSFIDEILPNEYSVKFLADNYGGGIFHVKVYIPRQDESGADRGVKLICNKRVPVEGPPKAPRRDTGDVTPMPSGGNDMFQLGRIMTDGFKQLGELMVRSQPPPKSTLEIAKELLALKGLFADNRPQQDPFSMIEKLAGAMSALRPPAEGEGGAISEMVRLFGPVVRDAYLQQRQGNAGSDPNLEQPQLTETGTAPAAPDNVVSMPTPQTSPTGEEMSPQDLIYMGYVKLLVNNARAQNPTQPIAEQIYENAPSEFINQICTDPKILDLLARYNNGVNMFRPWFEKLRTDIKALSDADTEGTGE